MDQLDQAQDYEERHRQESLRQTRRRAQWQQLAPVRNGKTVCTDCLEPIPPARLNANPHAVRCMSCQQDHEQGAVQHGL